MNELANFKGQNGIIIITDDYIELSRKSIGGIVSQGGFVGERKYYYKDISAVEYKKPTLLANGYFKIIVQGTYETDGKVGLLSSSMKSMKDQNTIIIRAFSKKTSQETDRINELINKKLKESKENSNNTNKIEISKMDELKKLGELKDIGVLTEQEFQEEKKKLLNN